MQPLSYLTRVMEKIISFLLILNYILSHMDGWIHSIYIRRNQHIDKRWWWDFINVPCNLRISFQLLSTLIIFILLFQTHYVNNHFMFLQVGSDSYQGAGAPTMFEAMRRIIACLGQHSVGESGFARAIRHSFLGMLSVAGAYIFLIILSVKF